MGNLLGTQFILFQFSPLAKLIMSVAERVRKKKAEKYPQLCYSGGEVMALDCRCGDCICCVLQLCILLLFRCHRSLGNKAHLNILFVTDVRDGFFYAVQAQLLKIVTTDLFEHAWL